MILLRMAAARSCPWHDDRRKNRAMIGKSVAPIKEPERIFIWIFYNGEQLRDYDRNGLQWTIQRYYLSLVYIVTVKIPEGPNAVIYWLLPFQAYKLPPRLNPTGKNRISSVAIPEKGIWPNTLKCNLLEPMRIFLYPMMGYRKYGWLVLPKSTVPPIPISNRCRSFPKLAVIWWGIVKYFLGAEKLQFPKRQIWNSWFNPRPNLPLTKRVWETSICRS